MKIYTRTGDAGATQIYVDKPQRLPKSDAVLNCYGDIDELNCHLGLLVSMLDGDATLASLNELNATLTQVQKDLFTIGFAMSASAKLEQHSIDSLEQTIDTLTAQLPAQTSFILPGGSQPASQAHITRAVCRRAERSLVALAADHSVDEKALAYLNRLSDLLYTVARFINHSLGVSDVAV